MIRTTITTLTLTAVTIIALATASPVLAASPSDEAPLTAETTVEASDTTCTIDTGFGSIPCPVLDWNLGGLFDSASGSDGPTVVGGTRSDAIVDIVGARPARDLVASLEEASPADGSGRMVEVTGGVDDLREALREAGIDLVEPDTAGGSAEAEGTTTTIQAAASTDQSSTPAASTFSTTISASSGADSRINNGPPTNSIDEDAQSILDLAQAGASILTFDRMLIALLTVFGILGGLGIMTVLLIAFALGRRNG